MLEQATTEGETPIAVEPQVEVPSVAPILANQTTPTPSKVETPVPTLPPVDLSNLSGESGESFPLKDTQVQTPEGDTSNPHIGYGEAVTSAMGRSGLITGVLGWDSTEDTPIVPWKASDIADGENTDPVVKRQLKELMLGVLKQDKESLRVYERFTNANNQQDAEDVLTQHGIDSSERLIAGSKGWTAEFLGDMLGVAPDIAASVALGAAAGPALSAVIVSQAARVGVAMTVAAAEGYAERIVQAQEDMTVDGNSEGLVAALASAGLVGVVGGVVVKLTKAAPGDVPKPTVAPKSPASTGGAVRSSEAPRDDSAGAMRAQGTAVETKGGLMLTLAGAVPKIMAEVTRGARGRLDSMLTSGESKAAASANKIIGTNRAQYDDTGALIPREYSVEDAMHQAQIDATAAKQGIDSAYAGVRSSNELVNKHVNLDLFNTLITKHRRGVASGLTPEQYIPQELMNQLGPDGTQELVDALAKGSVHLDNVYRAQGDRQVALGTLTDNKIIDGYSAKVLRPDADEGELTDYVLGEMGDTMDLSKLDPDLLPDSYAPGDTLADLIRKDKPAALRLLEESEDLKRSPWEKALDDADFQWKEFASTARANKLAEMEELRIKLEARLIKRESGSAKLLNATKRQLERLKKAVARLEADTFTERSGNMFDNTTSKELVRLRAAVKDAQKAFDKTPEPGTILEQAQAIARKMSGGKDINMVPDNVTARLSSEQDRVFKHGQELTNQKLHDRLFVTNATELAGRSFRKTAPAIRLRELFGHEIEEGEDLYEAVVNAARRDLVDPDSAEAKEVMALLEGSLKIALGKDKLGVTEQGRRWDTIARVATKFNIGSLLSNLVIAQVSDLALLVARAGRPGTGIFGLGKRGEYIQLSKALQESDQGTLNVILNGSSSMDAYMHAADLLRGDTSNLKELFKSSNSRANQLNGVDNHGDLTANSGFGRTVEGVADAVANASGFLSFATLWTGFIRRSVGGDILRQIGEDVHKFSQLSPKMRDFYMEKGMDDYTAGRLSAFMRDNPMTIEGMDLPNLELLRNQDPSLFSKVTSVFNKAADEATPVPNVFDKPFFSRTALGKVMLQFTSWGFAIGSQVIPQIERDVRNKNLARSGALMVGGMITSAMTLHLRSLIHGNHDELVEKLGTVEGRIQYMQSVFLLAPFLPGSSSQIMEAMAAALGPMVNEMAGAEYVTDKARYQGNVGIMGKAFGPTAGQVERGARIGGNLWGALNSAVKGDTGESIEDLEKAGSSILKMTPLLNSLPVRAITQALLSVSK